MYVLWATCALYARDCEYMARCIYRVYVRAYTVRVCVYMRVRRMGEIYSLCAKGCQGVKNELSHIARGRCHRLDHIFTPLKTFFYSLCHFFSSPFSYLH